MVPYLEFSVGLCCWQIWHPTTAITRSFQWVKVNLLSPCITHISAVHGPIGQWQRWLGKEADCPQKWSSCLLYYWTLLQLKSPFGEHWHGTQASSHPLSIWRNIFTYFFLTWLSHQLSHHVLFKSLTIQWIHWLQSMDQLNNYKKSHHSQGQTTATNHSCQPSDACILSAFWCWID